MNALHTTFTGLTEALASVARAASPLTLRDVCRKIPRGQHTLVSLEVIANIGADIEIDRVMRRLDALINREEAKRGHWSFDHNRLMALIEHRAKLERYYANSAGRRM